VRRLKWGTLGTSCGSHQAAMTTPYTTHNETIFAQASTHMSCTSYQIPSQSNRQTGLLHTAAQPVHSHSAPHIQNQPRSSSPALTHLSSTSFPMAALQPPALPVPPPTRIISQPVWRAPHDASHCHPVFFTERLRRQPLSFAAAPTQHASPVTHGYVYQDALRVGFKGTAGPRL